MLYEQIANNIMAILVIDVAINLLYNKQSSVPREAQMSIPGKKAELIVVVEGSKGEILEMATDIVEFLRKYLPTTISVNYKVTN
ncbi:hypothetical protein EXS66_00555 [Candidatus Saccharibacteria bacterium]|nr:hypothetical protein [Candidatus Saccharibacteria bacterium]